MSTSVHFSEPGHAIAACGDVFITILREPPTIEFMRRLRPLVRDHQARYGGPTRGITVMESGAMTVLVAAEVREEGDALLRDFPGAGTVYVVEGHGFAVAAIRTILAGVHLIRRKAGAYKIVATAQDGAQWLVRHAPVGPSPVKIDEASLIAAIESARDAAQKGSS